MTPLAGYAATAVAAALITLGCLMLGDERATPLLLVALFACAFAVVGCLAVLT